MPRAAREKDYDSWGLPVFTLSTEEFQDYNIDARDTVYVFREKLDSIDIL